MIKFTTKITAVCIVLLMMIISIACCYDSNSVDSNATAQAVKTLKYRRNSASVDEGYTERNYRRLLVNQPPPQLTFSLERANLIKRIKRWNDANKVSYIYLLSQMGQIISFYTIKGKVSSVNSLLSSDRRVIDYGGTVYDYQTIPSPDFDGSFGSNGNAIFFFTTDNTYVEWNGRYLLCDKPLKLTSRPVLVNTIR